MKDLLRTDPKQMNCRTSCTTSERRNLVSIGSVWTSKKSLWAEAVECNCYLRHAQDLTADVQTPCERRFNSLSGRPLIPFGAEVQFYPKSVKIHGLRLARGEEIGLVICFSDTEDLKTMPPSDSHVKRFKSKEVNIPKRNGECVLPHRTGDILQDGQSSSTVVYQAEDDQKASI